MEILVDRRLSAQFAVTGIYNPAHVEESVPSCRGCFRGARLVVDRLCSGRRPENARLAGIPDGWARSGDNIWPSLARSGLVRDRSRRARPTTAALGRLAGGDCHFVGIEL